jgi:hypothetical protein
MIRIALVALLWCGCHAPMLRVVPATAAYVEAPAWNTLTANHRVTVTVDLDGKRDTKKLRGIVAVERPDRLRLRALGPAGITLFDLIVNKGEAKIVSSIRNPNEGSAGQTLAEVIRSLAADLACAYTLEPRPPERHVTVENGVAVVEEPGRRVQLSSFAGTPPIWRHADISAGRYHVVVEVDDAEIDPTLDPSMFDD